MRYREVCGFESHFGHCESGLMVRRWPVRLSCRAVVSATGPTHPPDPPGEETRMHTLAARETSLCALSCDITAVGTNGQISQWGRMQAGAPPWGC